MKKTREHSTDLLFTLALFGVLIVSALMVMVIGSHVYQATADRMDMNYTKRTSLSYISNKVKQHDTQNAVTLKDFQGVPALVLEEVEDNASYYTYIYYYDHALRELFVEDIDDFSLADGLAITELAKFDCALSSDGLLEINTTDVTGQTNQLILALRSTQSTKEVAHD